MTAPSDHLCRPSWTRRTLHRDLRGELPGGPPRSRLTPRAPHDRPRLPDDDLTATLTATLDYVQNFIDEFDLSTDSRDLVARMQRRYPDHGNPSALILSAVTAFRRRKAEPAEVPASPAWPVEHIPRQVMSTRSTRREQAHGRG
jgi:hypothetical protein